MSTKVTFDEFDPSVMIAYVDGSFDKETKTFGSGCVIIHNGLIEQKTSSGTDPLKASMRNVAGEVDAAMMAMTTASNTKGVKTLVIYHDYIGIEKWCTGEWKANKVWTQIYQNYYNKVSKQIDIQFVKVAAHSGDKYNDMADNLAKKACGLI